MREHALELIRQNRSYDAIILVKKETGWTSPVCHAYVAGMKSTLDLLKEEMKHIQDFVEALDGTY